MIDEDKEGITKRNTRRRKQQDVAVIRVKREPRRYASKHFTQSNSTTSNARSQSAEDSWSRQVSFADADEKSIVADAQKQAAPRIYCGLNVDELSSDSDLTDVPDDIGPDPFEGVSLVKDSDRRKTKLRKSNAQLAKRSPYFPDVPLHKNRANFLATLPFPPLSVANFGLMQEKLAHQPFRLLIATIFLNKTPGMRAMPVFYQLMEKYPTPEKLAAAEVEDVTAMIRHLGFQNQRARKCIAMAKVWTQNPPMCGKRYRKLHYPQKTDGKNVKEGEAIDDTDSRVAWEISHLPGLGPYSHDSWRMFCRDELRGKANNWLGEGSTEDNFEPEWKRVLPTDKELRAYMTWMWLKEGQMWNKETGETTEADKKLLDMAREGGVVHEPQYDDHLIVERFEIDMPSNRALVEKPAGDYIPALV